ncbi:hypothetical protein MCUN1_002682 [Malassezia cuniculi]|uniref:SRR1-like domain-containing protein n=1 Tax=Malassezia cuniculi TaxID=948313 RepID=A0AAF0EVB6_9BASI|nr:hypothetical protein MCUN1_002682 [Malassezia cuniculi]
MASARAILCLGIGRLCTTAAQEQAAFLLALRSATGCTSVTVYDPLFTPQDAAVLTKLDMSLPASNNCGSYTLDEPTIVYMPHCPKELYDALLRSNWSGSLATHTVIGNDFDDYAAGDLSTCPCIKRILPYVQRCRLPALDTAAPGSLDATVHTFFGDEWPQQEPQSGWSYKQTAAPRRRRRRKGPAPVETPVSVDPRDIPPASSPFWDLPEAAQPGPEVLDTAIDDALAQMSF